MAFPTPKRITELDLASPLTDADQIAIVQNNRTKRATIAQVNAATDTSCECTLVSRYTEVGTDANTLTKYLYTYQLPSDTLNVDGAWLEIYASGYFLNNANSKEISIELDSTATGYNASLCTASNTFNDKYWEMTLRIQRSSSNNLRIDQQVKVNSYSPLLVAPVSRHIVSEATGFKNVWANDLSISVIATNGTANANDITCSQFIVRANLLDANS